MNSNNIITKKCKEKENAQLHKANATFKKRVVQLFHFLEFSDASMLFFEL